MFIPINPPHTGGNRKDEECCKDATTLNMKIMATTLKFDTTTLTWSQVGNMTRVRQQHGASVVKAAEVRRMAMHYGYCNRYNGYT